MAATGNGTTPVVFPTSQAKGSFVGEEFSNNLFSDLAPLLTLFGEQVTKQFLTMSLGWADNVLLAMGPLGILTVVVSAIRVGGTRGLKALVGRARESRATAEQELLSSTSDSVCELWSGQAVVRQLGQPDMKELIVAHDGSRVQVLNLAGAITNRCLEMAGEPVMFSLVWLVSEPPNITLNVEGSTPHGIELWGWAIVGIVLQLVALAIPALATYSWNFPKASAPVQSYAYPCFVAGALAVIVGVMLCSRVIESVTQEYTFEPTEERGKDILHVLRLQKACRVGDQSFAPFLIYNKCGRNTIRLSRLMNTKSDFASNRSMLAAAASLLTVSGFICQFVGLRGLHWSATVLQLGVTLIMTAARSWIRRGLAANPPHTELEPGNELLLAAKVLSLKYVPEGFGADESKFTTLPSSYVSLSDHLSPFRWELVTGGLLMDRDNPWKPSATRSQRFEWAKATIEDAAITDPKSEEKKTEKDDSSMAPTPSTDSTSTIGDNTLQILTQLQTLMPDDNAMSAIASRISQSMDETLSLVDRYLSDHPYRDWEENQEIEWTHHFCHGTGNLPPQPLRLSCAKGRMPRDKIYAILRLWVDSWTNGPDDTPNRTDKVSAYNRQSYIRILGPHAAHAGGMPPAILELLPQWIGKELFLCPKPDGSENFQSRLVSRSEAPSWPVFGLSIISTDDSIAALYSQETSPPLFTDGYQYDEDKVVMETSKKPYLAVISNHDMATQCALELFSGFMEPIASHISRVGLNFTDRGIPNSADVLPTLRWSNSVLNSIAQTLVNSGVVKSIEEANIVIIPPFARRGLLLGDLEDVGFQTAGDAD